MLIEEDHDLSPVNIGVLDPDGHPIFRIPYRDTVPLGFLDREEEEEDEDWC